MKDPFLMSLLEAPGDPPAGMVDPFSIPTDSPTDQSPTEQNAASPAAGNDPTGMGDMGADPFADPNAAQDPGAGMDLNNNPDGLPGPDATGDANLGSFSGEDEKNLQVKIIQASKLERSLLKRRIFDRFTNLYNKVEVFRTNIDNNQTVIDPKIREKAYCQLQKFSEDIDMYLEYKFTPNNYEENLKNYLVFSKKFIEIVDFVKGGASEDDKK